jgi:hypothetical protein
MKEETSPSGATDDAVVTQEVGGSKLPVFGLAIDTIGRTTPTHMIPGHVRQALVAYAAGDIPWYAEDDTDSVATRLVVTTAEAEKFGLGVEVDADENAFVNYTDVPLSPYTLDRLAFWRYDKDASEFDASMKFEPQVCALDAFTQLFTECFDFHFQYLAILDSEYHRLRPAGKLGMFGADRQNTAWNAQYHYWRDRVKQTYLDTNLVTLPAGLDTANWTIADVLLEILKLMTDEAGNFRADIFLTAKGALQAKSGATLGLMNDAAYTDHDGNPRWYQPAWQAEILEYGETVDTCSTSAEFTVDQGKAYGTPEGRNPLVIATGTDVVAADSTTDLPQAQSRTLRGVLEWALLSNQDDTDRVNGRAPTWFVDYVAANPDWYNAVELKVNMPENFLQSLTAAAEPGQVQDSFYWRGYQLNMVELTNVARRLGRGLEPEVAAGFLPMFGLLSSPAQIAGNPSAMSAREYDDLYNLYESSYSFNENPIRIYIAAHMGPIDNTLVAGELVLEGVDMSTKLNEGQTLRERFWTPQTFADDAAVGAVLNYYFPGADFEATMLGDIVLHGSADDMALAHHVDHALVARLLGNVSSMHTKVEKPVILKAGVASPDAAYASGIGVGGLQMLVEMLTSSLGGKPSFNLGHNGYIDWAVTGSPEIADPANPLDSEIYYPRSRHESAEADVPVYGYSLDEDALGDLLMCSGFNRFSEIGTFMELSNEVPQGTATTAHAYTKAIVENLKLSMAPAAAVGKFWDLEGTNGGVYLVATDSSTCAAAQAVELSGFNATDAWGILSVPTGSDTASDRLGDNGDLFNQNWYSAGHDLWMISAPKDVTFSSGTDSVTVDWDMTQELVVAPATEGPRDLPSDGVYEAIGTGKFVGGSNLGSEFGFGYQDGSQDGATISSVDPNDHGYAIGQAVAGDHTINDNIYGVQMATGSMMRYLVPSASPSEFLKAALMERVENAPSTHSWLTKNGTTSTVAGVTTTSLDFEMRIAKWGQWGLTVPTNVGTLWQGGSGGNDNCVPLGYMVVTGTITTDDAVRSMSDITGLNVEFAAGRKQFAGADLSVPGTVSSTSRTTVTVTGTTTTRGYTGAYAPTSSSAQPVTSAHVGNVLGIHTRSGIEDDYLFCLPTQPGTADSTTWSTSYGLLGSAQTTGANVPGVWLDPQWTYEQSPDGAYAAGQVGPALFLGVVTHLRDATLPAVPATASNSYATYQFQVPAAAVNTYSSASGFALGTCMVTLSDEDWSNGVLGHGSTSYLRFSETGPSTSTNTEAIAYAGPDASSATYIIPDDPDHRMIYRPWRVIVDAAIAREQKMMFMPTHENPSAAAGSFGLPAYGTQNLFRLAQMHYDVPEAYGVDAVMQYILEKAAGKTRLVDSSNRGMLTFTKATLVDPTTSRHLLPDMVRELNDMQYVRGDRHKMSVDGKAVYSRELIRDIQLGRQRQKMANS